jgi:type II secretory pathway component PulF
MSKTSYRLSVEQLATLFTQLQRLESAGLPAVQAFEIVAKSALELKKPLAVMLHNLKSGLSISEAGFKAGIFNDTQKTLIHAAETSGRLADVYGLLAKYYCGLDSRIKKVKSRLYLPAFMLTLALFIQPLPALIGSQISGSVYLRLSLGRLLVLGISVLLLVKLPRILHALGVEKDWHRLQLRIPGLSQWIAKRQINEFFIILAMMLESGLAFAVALPKAVSGIRNNCLKEKFAPALSTATSGGTAAETLARVPVISPVLLNIVKSGEYSGKLSSTLLHFSQQEAETISLQDDALAEWIPRLMYGMVALWIAYSLLTNQIASGLPSGR